MSSAASTIMRTPLCQPGGAFFKWRRCHAGERHSNGRTRKSSKSTIGRKTGSTLSFVGSTYQKSSCPGTAFSWICHAIAAEFGKLPRPKYHVEPFVGGSVSFLLKTNGRQSDAALQTALLSFEKPQNSLQ
eukprot:8382763-Pyramimonas_sp.AAC.1